MVAHSESKRKADRERYRRNIAIYRATGAKKSKRVRTAKRDFVNNYKNSTPCSDCGIIYPYYVMDFDHIIGEKKFELCRGKWIMSWRSIAEEISKCDLVCANCHRKRTWDRSLWIEKLGLPSGYRDWEEIMYRNNL